MSRHDHTLGRLPIRHQGQRLVRLFQREAVRDHLVERESLALRTQEAQCGVQMARFARPGAEHLKLLARDHARIELDRARVAIVPENQILPAIATHFHAFADH